MLSTGHAGGRCYCNHQAPPCLKLRTRIMTFKMLSTTPCVRTVSNVVGNTLGGKNPFNVSFETLHGVINLFQVICIHCHVFLSLQRQNYIDSTQIN